MMKSARKQQSQVQTIQKTVTIRNVTQDNSNINNFSKGGPWFCRQCLRTLRKRLFGKLHLCSRFKQRPVPIDEVFCTHCMLYVFQSSRFQLTALPDQTMQKAQNTLSIISLTCSFKHAHICISTNATMCLKPFVHIYSMTSSKKFTYTYFEIARVF